jgi:hypothetical protein
VPKATRARQARHLPADVEHLLREEAEKDRLEIMRDRKLFEERMTFLRAASRHPEIRLADKLRKQVYEMLPAQSDDRNTWGAWTEQADQIMADWAKDLNLAGQHRVITEAWRQINSWNDGGKEPFRWHQIAGPPKFELPVFTGQGDYVQTVLRQGRDLAVDYVERSRALRKVPGRKRIASVEQRYEWAALRICLLWSYRDIAEYYSQFYEQSISLQALQKAVDAICRRLGFST